MFGQNENEIEKQKSLNMTLGIIRSNTHNKKNE